MKKIGILFGQENTFPQAFVDRVNEKAPADIRAEFVHIDQVEQHVSSDYAVIVDRISQDVPFYRAYLKNAALMGTAVINNPFWWSADEKFFNNALAVRLGVPVPKTLLLPSKERPTDTSERSFRNLGMMDWEAGLCPHRLPGLHEAPLGRRLEKRVQAARARRLFSGPTTRRASW